jgi:VanZ family protein
VNTVRKIDGRGGSRAYGRLIRIFCLCILGTILVAGLWPFHAPRNRVKWLQNKDGLEFIPDSGIRSTEAFHSKSQKDNTSESIEIWLVPSSIRSPNTILSFDGSDHPGAAFLLRQYKDELIVRQPYIDSHGIPQVKWLAVGNAVSEGKSTFVTITMGERGTSIYLNGILSESFANRGKSTNNLTGLLVVGDAPQGRDCWPGQVLGLAMYGSQLTPSQVAEHYASWKRDRQPVIRNDEAQMALYTFKERKGRVVLNQLDFTNKLIISDHYFALHPQFLSSVMRDYQPTWAYWQNVGVNIVGFLPYGFFFAILWSEVWTVKHPAVTTISVGLLISLTIEVLQVFLPTRSSGSTDLITNTLGTAIGVMIHSSGLVQSLLISVRQRFGISVGPVVDMHPSAENTSADLIVPSEDRASMSARSSGRPVHRT